MGTKTHALTPDQVLEFYDKGFVVLRSVFQKSEIQKLQTSFDQLERAARQLGAGTHLHSGSQFVLGQNARGPHKGQTIIQRVVWCCATDPYIDQIAQDPRLLSIASQILSTTRFHQLICQAHFKLPYDGVDFPWHQDIEHRDKYPGAWKDINGLGSYVQMLLAVDPNTRKNGPVRMIPYSGLKGRITKRPDRKPGDPLPAPATGEEPGYKQVLKDGVHFDSANAVEMIAAPGDLVLFGPYTIHGSAPNTSTNSRRVLINGYAVEGANSMAYPGQGSGRLLVL